LISGRYFYKSGKYIFYKIIVMKKYLFHFFIAGSIVFLVCCNTAADEKTNMAAKDSAGFDLSAAKAWIERDNDKFAEEIEKGDSLAVAAHYASDGWAMVSNMEPLKGKDIASGWGAVIRMGVKDVKIITDDVTGNEELLAETGRYEMYGEGNKVLDKGKYVVVWKKEDGTWKIYRDIGNSSLPVAGGK
jgi:ketosteroid isomerase-like protein